MAGPKRLPAAARFAKLATMRDATPGNGHHHGWETAARPGRSRPDGGRAGVVAVLGIMGLWLAATGCGPAAGPERIPAGGRWVHRVPPGTALKLALVPNSCSRFWDLARSGLNKFEQETGIHVPMLCPTRGTLDEQRAILERLEREGYHGVMISVVSPEEQTPLINRLAERMNVITVDSDAPQSRRLVFVGPQHYDMGLAAGMAIVRLLPEGGEIAVFCGELTAENFIQRLQGLSDAIRNHRIRIVAKYEDRTDLDRARRQVAEALETHPELDLLVGLWSYNGGIIREVLQERGLAGRVLAVAVAEEEETLQGIEDGSIQCGVAQTAFDCAYLGARLLRDLALQGPAALPPGGVINTGFILVDRSNLHEVRETRRRQSSY
ncbi:MAG: hypothetical protein D6766_06645 [Verrucomicrobia bacterium]|nr:MAG: hypothetical protein D6766_06645 [Verrucomicrobiota bacterium]